MTWLALYPLARPAYLPHEPAGLDAALSRFEAAASAYRSGRPAQAAGGFLAAAVELRLVTPDDIGTRTVAYWNTLVCFASVGDAPAGSDVVRTTAADDPQCADAVAAVAASLFGG
ncbi:hypothetical protein [Nakamurella sp.]|uniref:hypothetical protein n=1 Tax=Nakamurella sp. TaxID=1869182 RepID=UPI00378429BC